VFVKLAIGAVCRKFIPLFAMILNKNILEFIGGKAHGDFQPYYVYDVPMIRSRCHDFNSLSYRNKSIHFASMANAHPRFLSIIREESIDIFVNSIPHLQTALEAGFKAGEIIFTSSALTEKAMKYAYECKAQVNLDSPRQLSLWNSLFPGKPVGIRCNIGDNVVPQQTHAGYFIGSQSRIGFTRQEIDQIADKSMITGLHLYAGTDIRDIGYFIDCYKELIHISEAFPNLEYLNFGGGFGVSENGDKYFDLSEYDKQVTRLMTKASENRGYSIKMILEPGRIIGCESGFFVCMVTDIKKRENERLVGLNASIVQFPRPLFYPDTAKHPIMIIRGNKQLLSAELVTTSVYGCSTYSRDFFSKKTSLPELLIGDIVVFGCAGVYSASSFTNFLGFPKPEEYYL
jgi:diaminopimelate decarboxylase